MAHTPGPWTAYTPNDGSEYWEVYDCYGHTATVYGDDDEAADNARLIAAAPAMLDALMEIADGCESRLRKGKDAGDLQTIRLCRRAISLTEGRVGA